MNFFLIIVIYICILHWNAIYYSIGVALSVGPYMLMGVASSVCPYMLIGVASSVGLYMLIRLPGNPYS